MSKQRECKLSNFIYYLREGLSNVFRHGFMSFASVGITVACLLIMGTFTLVAVNANALLRELEESTEILAFVEDSLSEEEVSALAEELKGLGNITAVEFISREQAKESFAEKYEDSNLMQDLDASIFRHRYAIHIADLSQQSQTVEQISQLEGIAKVNAYEEVSAGFTTVRNIASVVCVSLVSILFLVSAFIISNTIKLTTFDRREEIAIMKMVGASDGFIRGPFICEGIIIGVLCAVIAFFLQWGLYDLVLGQAADSATVQLSLFTPVVFAEIWKMVFFTFGMAGLLIGVGGSLSAIRKFLQV